MGSELRVGLVGCGRLAQRGYVPALRLAAGLRLVAMADPEPSRCEELAPGIPRHESAAELIAAGGVDALVLATPAAAHLADAQLAARGGLPALVEKPPAANASEAEAMAALEPSPWMGFNRRFEPGIARLRPKIPATGSLEVTLELHNPAGSWGSYVVADDVLAATGPHLIDLASWLSGSDIEGVRSSEVAPDRALLDLDLARGRATVSCRSGAPHRDRIEVIQSGRRLAAHAGDALVYRVSQRLTRPRLTNLVALLVRQLEEFASAARGGLAPSLATASDGVAVMRVIDEVRAAGSATEALR